MNRSGLMRDAFTLRGVDAHAATEQPLWLFSRRADFWLASGGASTALLAALLAIVWWGDRELDMLDLVLSELHLGATYDAIVRRRLWRHRRVDVLVVPFVILALTSVLSMSGQTIWLTSIAMYAAVWHRGRQSLGVARFYQRAMGGPVSRMHEWLFRGAIYLPMLAGMLAYTYLAPTDYEGEPYLALTVGAEITSAVTCAAAAWVIAYLAWMLSYRVRPIPAAPHVGSHVHSGEWWVVLAHAVAFGSGYVLGATNVSFVLVLAVHHEVQYLGFTYAMARRRMGSEFRAERQRAASFLLLPGIGVAGAVVGGWLELEWLVPLGVGGLFCHYWLDGRIWTGAAMRI
jgi:hypothetical protein